MAFGGKPDTTIIVEATKAKALWAKKSGLVQPLGVRVLMSQNPLLALVCPIGLKICRAVEIYRADFLTNFYLDYWRVFITCKP